jgi:GTP-binding protein
MIGYRSELLMDTRGTAIMNRQFKRYGPVKSTPSTRRNGALVSMESGEAVAFALWNLEDRGVMFISPGDKLYDGIIIGEHSRDSDLEVNPVKGKKLTNMRASGKDEAVTLTTPRAITLECALTYINDDELVEVTPLSIRLRKRGLDTNARKRISRSSEAA